MTETAWEFLLAFDGQEHVYADGHYLRFKVVRVPKSEERPHGFKYSFSMHAPDGTRLIGFDNAHGVSLRKGGAVERPGAHDHRHGYPGDEGRVYVYEGAEKLLDDFQAEVERMIRERNVDGGVVDVRNARTRGGR